MLETHLKRIVGSIRRPVVILLLCALVVFSSFAVYAVVTKRNPLCLSQVNATLNLMSVENITRASTMILIGSVKQVGPSWQSISGWVFTDVTVNASEYLKGSSSQTIQLRTDGGFTSCGGLIKEDQASFSKGQQVLLFLNPSTWQSDESYLTAVGGPQGKYTITGSMVTGGIPTATQPLEDLKTEIRQYL